MFRSLTLLSLFSFGLSVSHAVPSPEALTFFESKVRPILVNQCQECHGAQKKKGGLRLDNLPYILQGGEQGPALVPHKASESLLIKAVEYADKDMQMPPDGKMSDADIITLKQWITMGAPWPEAEVASAKLARKPGQITDEDRQWWAFKPVDEPPVPVMGVIANAKSQPTISPQRNAIDAFVRAKLKDAGLRPSPEASPEELIRRVTFDLTGLPPKPERVTKFVAECADASKRDAAYKQLVEELLASPRYGERWAQHWLDLVRYAESDGYRQDAYRPNAWAYRDYVIESLNKDKPYDQFVREQIAGDEIAPDDPKSVIGTAFLRHSIYEYNQRDAEGQWRATLDEVTDVTGDVFMGLSIQCAHCHDHKFDPILQKDYYRLQAFFANITWPENQVLATAEERRQHDEQMKAWEAATEGPRHVIDSILEPRIEKAQKTAMEKFPDEIQAMWRKPKEERTPWEEQVVQFAWRQAELERVRLKEEKLKSSDSSRLSEARHELARFASLKPKPLQPAFVIGETGNVGAETKFKTRRAGEVKVNPGFLTLLDPTDATIPEPSGNATTTGRRTVLANWLTRPDNPLTTRVIVNRVWQWHFGKGIAGTASDFGHLGEKPVNPELLDWLTSQFVNGGWKLKDLHRLIVTSATYRQTSRGKPEETAMMKDPENRLLWRFTPRRLDAEQARDAVLAVSGELTERMTGEGEERTKPCRSIYLKHIRNTQDGFLAAMDQPAGFQSIAERQSTTTATQSLLLVNGDWPLERARAMAAHLLKTSPSTSDADLVRQLYQALFSRKPRTSEIVAAVEFMKVQRAVVRGEKPKAGVPSSPLADARKIFGPAASTTKTMMVQPGTENEKLRVNLNGRLEDEQFSIQAVVMLKSLYPDSGVRTIVSRWNNGKGDMGWSFGVTSEKSAHKPNNLIMQLSGEDFQGSQLYEVVASGLRIPLNKPYYVAASIDPHPAEGHQFGSTITFYARDLSDPSAETQTVTVSSQVCGEWVNDKHALYVGGRDQDKKSLWDGAIARVSVRNGLLDAGKLMTWTSKPDTTCVADITADEVPNMTIAPETHQWTWESSQTSPPTSHGSTDSTKEALADLCHALINSNEFFYLH